MDVSVITVNMEALFICSILLLLLFWFNLSYWKPKYLNPISCSYLMVFLNCYLEMAAFWADGKTEYRWLNWWSNGIYLILINCLVSCYLHYCNGVLPKPLWKNRKQQALILLPCLVEMILVASSFWTKIVYYIDAQGFYHRAGGFGFQFIPYGYLAVLSVIGLKQWNKAQSVREKRLFGSIALFIIPPVVLGIIQLISPPNSMATLEFGLFMSYLIMYHMDQDNRITRDPLTKLPNRQVLDFLIEDGMREARKENGRDLYIMMGDLDGFKAINDTFGHVEGDRALIKTADILYNLAGANGATAARYGGDEFVIVLNTNSEEIPKKIRIEVDEELSKASKNEKYKLAMSFGYAKYRETDSISDILKAADKSLYQIKAERKAGRK